MVDRKIVANSFLLWNVLVGILILLGGKLIIAKKNFVTFILFFPFTSFACVFYIMLNKDFTKCIPKFVDSRRNNK